MRRDSGFAIGLILVAVVLVGAIVGAIAISSSNSSAKADAEQKKIEESAVLFNVQQLIVAAQRFDAATGGGGRYVVANVEVETGMTIQTLMDLDLLPSTFEVLPGIPAASASGIWDLGAFFRVFFVLVDSWDADKCMEFNGKWQNNSTVYPISIVAGVEFEFPVEGYGAHGALGAVPGNIFCGMNWNYVSGTATFALVVSL